MFDDGWEDFDAAATLDAAVEFDVEENRAALGKLQAALHFADLHADLPTAFRKAPTVRGGERFVVYGGDGCPAIAEFAPAEFGVLLKMSSGAAAAYIGDGLALRHRLPRIWAKTCNGQAIVWRARAVARACLKLSREAAALVDERVVGVIDTLSAYGLGKIVDAVVKEADPEAARQAAEQRARERGVWVEPSDDHGTKAIYVKAAAGDVIRLDATVNDLAWALQMLGDPDPLQARRAKAIGWIADPAAAYELLSAARYLSSHPRPTSADNGEDHGSEGGADDLPLEALRRGRVEAEDCFVAEEPGADDEADRDPPHPSVADQPHPEQRVVVTDSGRCTDVYSRHQLVPSLAAIKQSAYSSGLGSQATSSRPGHVILYVHLTDQTLLSGEGIVRVENHGPLLAAQLTELLGHDQVIVKPVIDLNDNIDVNAYEIPARIRERVRLAHPVDRFPYGTAQTTTRTDLDHIQPYEPHGPPGQTSTTNLTPTTRFHHRVKTHGRWQVEHTAKGALQWTTPNGFTFRVDQTGTTGSPTDDVASKRGPAARGVRVAVPP
jgi:hypothetical protein